MYQIRTSSAANRDLRKIADFIALDKPRAAHKWLNDARRHIESLADFPERFEVIPENEGFGVDYRHIIFGNYRILFRIASNEVMVVRVIHAARDIIRALHEGDI